MLTDLLILYRSLFFTGCILRFLDAASKHALHGYYDSLRGELSPRGIAVTLVCLGYIQTRLSVNALTGDGSRHGGKHVALPSDAYHEYMYRVLDVLEL